jgi:hypothetical protein
MGKGSGIVFGAARIISHSELKIRVSKRAIENNDGKKLQKIVR